MAGIPNVPPPHPQGEPTQSFEQRRELLRRQIQGLEAMLSRPFDVHMAAAQTGRTVASVQAEYDDARTRIRAELQELREQLASLGVPTAHFDVGQLAVPALIVGGGLLVWKLIFGKSRRGDR